MPRTLVRSRPVREEVIGTIVEAAVRRFAARGFAATTMQSLAAQLGWTAPALYYYFNSKQELLHEVITLNLQQFINRLEAALSVAAPSPSTELEAFIRTHLGFQLADLDRARLYNAMFLGTGELLTALTPRQRAGILALQRRVRVGLKATLERGVAAGTFAVPDSTVTTMAILAIGEFAGSWFRPGGGLTARAVTDRCVELGFRMVGFPTRRAAPATMRRTLGR